MDILNSSACNGLKTNLSKPASFASLGVQPDLVAALTAMSITSPSEIQQKAIPDILAGKLHPIVFLSYAGSFFSRFITDRYHSSLIE
jgi:superfamily II DNA/RNA helicase